MGHPLHFSMTNVEYDNDKQGFSVGIKLFTDDFQNGLIHKFGKNINLAVENVDMNSAYISKYINENFLIYIDGKPSNQLTFVSSKKHEDAIWVNFFLPTKNTFHKIEFENKLMLDLFENQTNLLIFYYDNVKQGFNLKNDNYKCKVVI
ncbi:MAG TPA: hypothetical protein DDX39_06775 [Bacteroidales bacterium]|nr:MAG: hypothetical protein A2W98_05855 [Bacteroidetes bacterium GWF2_33_38]OFY68178.1 MAG: hypothetical protein A2265_05145 [Bacteroidetes bacterium RIFOXYA12_FULL_33_9]OFY92153.1 MAG: hypothetical protein A2236_07530 [Bacteroidetes bacterium RIFOXYA2_FULL_33_7]HBF88331.1 hypothetical protein [Bacteroidales bacterium]